MGGVGRFCCLGSFLSGKKQAAAPAPPVPLVVALMSGPEQASATGKPKGL
jgi:hypothetical protein